MPRSCNVRPVIGVRVKLATRGAGRWKSSAGFRSKFGLTLTEVLEAFEYLKQRDMADCLQLLHFHLGSQITNIRNIKAALTEAARIYVELCRVGAGVKYLDVGGGLGIDYDGSQTDFESSVNYTLQEYANDVVFRIKSVCDEAERPAPDDHLRIGPGRGRLPQRAGLRRARRVELRPLPGAAGDRRLTRRSRSPTCSASTAISPRRTPWRAITMPCRRWTRR